MIIGRLGNRNIDHQHHFLVAMTQEPVTSLLLVYRLIKEKEKLVEPIYRFLRPKAQVSRCWICLSVKVQMARAPESLS